MENIDKEIRDLYKTINNFFIEKYKSVERRNDNEDSGVFYNYYPNLNDCIYRTIEKYHYLDMKNSEFTVQRN
tara:strand:+ start:374 stop:589 length:216 start_codon:yes stop_codon:yes gene_type:complete